MYIYIYFYYFIKHIFSLQTSAIFDELGAAGSHAPLRRIPAASDVSALYFARARDPNSFAPGVWRPGKSW